MCPNTCQSILPDWCSIFSHYSPVIHHVPKGARNAWARLVFDTFSAINEDFSNPDPWCRLFMLPRCVLSNPANGNRLRWRELLNIVRSRIKRWQSNEVLDLWSDFLTGKGKINHQNRVPKKLSHPDRLRASNARRAKRAVEAGQYRKAIQALTSEGLAPASSETLAEMLAKHPSGSLPPTPSSPPPPPPNIEAGEIIRALRSFPGDSAPGPSLLRASHIKEAVFCPSPLLGDKVLQAITITVNHLSAGLAPSIVVPHLCGATLLANKKRGGGHRPIAVGEVLRRLTSKCLSRAVQTDVHHVLTPLQLGVGVKAGCEAIVHAVSHTLEDGNLPPDTRRVLLLDFSNAFNNIDRSHMFAEIRARIPVLSGWVESCYSAQPLLHFGNHTILSQSGVQQGDPLGPLCFALTLHPIVEKIKREVPDLLINVWYLDDGTLCGAAQDLLKALLIIEEDGPSRGLLLNRSKSLQFIPKDVQDPYNPLPSEIPLTRVGFSLLGSPIGPASFCESIVAKRVDKIRAAVSKLWDLQDSQIEATLLRSCLSLPKFNFVLRTCPFPLIQHSILAFDDLMRESLSDLVGGPVSD